MKNKKYGAFPYPVIEQDNTLWSVVFNGNVAASKFELELLEQGKRTAQSDFDFEKSILNLFFIVEKGSMGNRLEQFTDTITDLVPFIVHAEAHHPGKFEKYRSLLEFVEKKAGVGSVVNRWKKHKENCASGHGTATGYGDRVIFRENEEVAISDKMKKHLQNLMLQDAISKGDVETTKKLLSEITTGPLSSRRIDMINSFDPSLKIGRSDLLSWILRSENKRPGHFLDYKEILDFVAKKDGVDKVIDRWKHPIYWFYWRQRSGHIFESPSVPTSPQMSGYLGHLEDVRTVYTPTPYVLKKSNNVSR